MGQHRFHTPAGEALRQHQEAVADLHLRDLLADPARPPAMTVTAGPLTIDFSRMLGDSTTLDLLADLAIELNVPHELEAMTSGALVNTTEQRAALHTALRADPQPPILVNGHDVLPGVAKTSADVSAFVEAVTSGTKRGASGERICDVVVIG
ncbi:MAG: glucose-6-phosphate isomerase, partial [Candidatus Nanopelagicales bacterium]